MGAAIIAALTALPGIVKILQDVGPEVVIITKNFSTWLEHVTGNDTQGYIKGVGAAFQLLADAKTPEEKESAAKNISKLIANLP